jgi:hypothetical protein
MINYSQDIIHPMAAKIITALIKMELLAGLCVNLMLAQIARGIVKKIPITTCQGIRDCKVRVEIYMRTVKPRWTTGTLSESRTTRVFLPTWASAFRSNQCTPNRSWNRTILLTYPPKLLRLLDWTLYPGRTLKM